MAINEHPEILFYTRLRKSPFFHGSRRHGVAAYSVYNHTYHPRHYGDPVAEYWALIEGATLWDVGVERQIEISGPDAFTFTNYLVPRDLNKCAVGQCKYVFITATDGGIINDPVLLRLEENRFWLSLADSDVELWALGVAHHMDLDVTIRPVDVSPVQIQGPKSAAVIQELFGPEILDLPYYFLTRKTLNGMDVVVSRTGYTAELGYEIYVHDATHNGLKLWDTVWEAGEPHGLQVIGPSHIRRIEGGILAHGADMDITTNPFEVGYGYEATWMVDLNQEADFVGKDALKKIRDNGISRKLVGVEIDGPGLGSYSDGSMIEFFPVRAAGAPAGRVTSACYSPRLEKNIGLAMVPIERADLGTELEVETPTGRQQAVVVQMPFYDPAKETPKHEVQVKG